MEASSLDVLSTDENQVEKSRGLSVTSDDLLYEDNLAETKTTASVMAADDQDVLLELNTEDQEQFEVLDTAEVQEGHNKGEEKMDESGE